LAAPIVVSVAVLLVAVVAIVAMPATHRRPALPADPPRQINPYRGLGAWVDMYSWSATFTGGSPTFGPADVAAVARAGVQTLYVQAASQTGPATALEPDRLDALISAAHGAGLSVVVWYQPTLVDVATDLARLVAISRLPADAVAVDIESTAVADPAARNSALISLSQQLRRSLPARLLGAIVLPPALLEVVNPKYWPDFPYAALAPSYNAWLPMVYWTDRLRASGYRDGYAYTLASITRLRTDLGSTTTPALISPIGGVSVDGLSVADLSGFVDAAKQTGSVGGSLYEWPGTSLADWTLLRPLRT
jgi:hypothetical protein